MRPQWEQFHSGHQDEPVLVNCHTATSQREEMMICSVTMYVLGNQNRGWHCHTGQPNGNGPMILYYPRVWFKDLSLASQYETGIPFTGQPDGNGLMILYYQRVWFKNLLLVCQYEIRIPFTGQPDRNGLIILYKLWELLSDPLLAGQYQIGVLCTGQTDCDWKYDLSQPINHKEY